MARRSLIESAVVISLFFLIALLIIFRQQYVDLHIGTYIACPGCFDTAVLIADLPLVAIIACGLLLPGWIRWQWPARLLHLTAGLAIVVYVADLIVFRLFSSRLFLADAALWIREGPAVWDQFSTGVGPVTAWSVLAGALGLLIGAWLLPPARNLAARVLLAGGLFLALLGTVTLESSAYVNDWAVDNVFAANLATTDRVKYSVETAQRLSRSPPEQLATTNAPPASSGNVVFVMLESWSAWHSLVFGGDLDWTPRLDAAAKQGLRFTDFHAIGFSTDKGLVGILAGQNAWLPFLHRFETTPFHSMWGVERTLPRTFDRNGYQTAFLTSGPLSLYRKGEWMTNIGFDIVEGNEHPYYADLPRYAFGAASDRALYERALSWQEGVDKPYMLVLETVTTHQPYVDPDSGDRSLEKAMRYADRAFGAYLDALEENGFFNNGWLVVVSDHRSMTPVPASEFERFGPGTFSRVPMFVLGEGLPAGAIDDRVLGQGDLVPSFEWALSGSTRLGPLDALLFDPASNPGKCALHARGDRRGLVVVLCPQGHGQVVLEGDRTRFVTWEGLGADQREAILEWIAYERLAGLDRHLQSMN